MTEPVSKVFQAFRRSEEFQAEWFERVKRYYSLYRGETSQSLYNVVTRSQYVVPVAFKTVETILPRLLAVTFSVSPPVQAAWRATPPEPGAEFKLRYLDYLFEYHKDHHNLFEVIQAWYKDALIYGQSYLKVGWKQTWQTKKVPMMEGDTIVEQEVKEVLEDHVDIQNVDVMDMFFSPEAQFPDPFATAKWVIHRSRKRKSQLIAMRDEGQYFNFDEDALTGSLTSGYDSDAPKDVKANEINRSHAERVDQDDPMITVYEYWEDDRVITEAEHSVLLRDEPNPFGLPGQAKKKPFVAIFDTLVPGELFQIGEVEPIEHTQVEMSTLRRMRTDNNNLIINKMYLYDKDADVDIESFELARPGGGVGARPAGQPLSNVLQPIAQGDINGASYREFQDLDKDAQEISGLLDYAVGSAPERRETATTVQLLQAAANQRFDIKVRNFNHCLAKLAYMMVERWHQFMTRPIPIKVPKIGEQGFVYADITREDLPPMGQIDLRVPGSPELLLKDARHQKLMQVYQALAQNPMAHPMAALQMLTLAIKEMNLDGIEPIVQLLEQPMPMPAPTGGNGGLPAAPSPPSGPPMGSEPQVNEFPAALPGPSPER